MNNVLVTVALASVRPRSRARASPASARPPAAPPAYRVPNGGAEAPAGAKRHEVDVEGCVALALLALGCAPPVVAAFVRHEVFSSEATVCGVLLVLALVPLVHEAGCWLAAWARALVKAPGPRGDRRPGESDAPLRGDSTDMDAIYLGLTLAFFALTAGLVRLCGRLERGSS